MTVFKLERDKIKKSLLPPSEPMRIVLGYVAEKEDQEAEENEEKTIAATDTSCRINANC